MGWIITLDAPQYESHGILLPGEPEFQLRPHGAFLVDGREVAHTLQCPHCEKHWVPIKGSGATRGYCMRCNRVTCGAEWCDTHCTPFEKQLDRWERRRR